MTSLWHPCNAPIIRLFAQIHPQIHPQIHNVTTYLNLTDVLGLLLWYKRLLLRDSSLLLKLESEAAAGSSGAEAAHSLAAEVGPPPRPRNFKPVMKAPIDFST